MKLIINNLTALLILLSFMSCSESSVMYYHDGEDNSGAAYQLVEVDYPQEDIMPYSRDNQILTYDNAGRIKTIDMKTSKIVATIEYKTDSIVIFMNTSNGLSNKVYYAVLNEKKLIDHLVCTSPLNEMQKDSISFKYDAQGYLMKNSFYEQVENVGYDLKFEQNYKITDGNITEVNTSSGNKYIYIYDNRKHVPASEYCYAMPKAVYQDQDFSLVSLLPVLYEYMGTKSENNVIHLDVEQVNKQLNTLQTDFSKVNYDYTYSSIGLLEAIDMTGAMNNNKTFEKLATVFSYIKK